MLVLGRVRIIIFTKHALALALLVAAHCFVCRIVPYGTFCAGAATSASMTEGSRNTRRKREEKRREKRGGRKEGGEKRKDKICLYIMQIFLIATRKYGWRRLLIVVQKYACMPWAASGRHIMPYAPPYFTPPSPARSRGAYLYGWRQEQAYVYAGNFPPAAGHIPGYIAVSSLTS